MQILLVSCLVFDRSQQYLAQVRIILGRKIEPSAEYSCFLKHQKLECYTSFNIQKYNKYIFF